ncbi:MAG TPA: AAA family ATPase, partial [Anaerolineales bacterium]|nr:AAA family ATPase [Anaerolineales bacterium]
MDLLERDLQLKALRSALNEAGHEGRVAFVYGEAGIGKTALVEHFIKENEKSWRILHGACDSFFTPRPLGPLYDIALQTERDLSAFLESESNRGRLFSACLSELQTQKTILVIEDIHWADEATLDLLKYLGRRIRQTKALLILTYRDDEIGTDHPLRLLLGDLASTHALHRISVSLLSKNAVQKLANHKNVDSLQLHRLTNGNPFFITEVLAAESGIPETVRDAVLARAARLSPSARALLEAAAVIGSRLEAWLLSEIVGADIVSVEECIARGLLQLQGDYYTFRHELSRQTILESISSQRKITLHRKTLNALQESSVTRESMTRLAHHAEAINDPDAVLEFAPLAAWWASTTSSHREAVALYELALRFAKSLPPANHAQMLEAYMVELEFMNRFSDEIEACQSAIALWHSIGNRLREGKNLATLAGLCMNVGRKSETEKSIERAITILEDLSPSAELAQAYTEQCYIKMMYRDCEEAITWGEKATTLAERFDDFDALARAYDYMGCAALIIDYDRGLKLLERSLVIAREKKLPFAVGGTLGNLGGMLLEVRQVTLANQYLAESIDYATQQDNDYHL